MVAAAESLLDLARSGVSRELFSLGSDSTPEFWRGGIHAKACQDTLSTFENSCLEGEMTFGDPFEDSGVVRVWGWPTVD